MLMMKSIYFVQWEVTAFNELRIHNEAEEWGVQTVGVIIFIILSLRFVWLLYDSGEKNIA